MRTSRRATIAQVGAVTAAAAALATAGVAAASGSTTISTEKTKPGKVLDTTSRHALYMFTKDSRSASRCSGSCSRAWRPLIASGRLSVARGSGLDSHLLSRIKIAGGKQQVAYNHHPLYTFSGDRKAGQTGGEGKHEFGGSWYLVSPKGDPVKPSCPPGYVKSSTGCLPGGY